MRWSVTSNPAIRTSNATDPAATPALRLLARLNGYTDLRRLIDLAPGDTREMSKAIQQLFRDGLIELVDLSM